MKDTHPFVALRKAIRQSGSQYMRDGYDADSIFHEGTESAKCYAYDIPKVEAALDNYVNSLPVAYQEEFGTVTLEQQVIDMATTISKSHVSMEARDFARTVRAYMAAEKETEKKLIKKPFSLLTMDRSIREEEEL